jgi:hypothetical protein
VSIGYSDGFSTTGSPTIITVFARDQEEYLASLEAQLPDNTDNTGWAANNASPGSAEASSGVTLPDVVEIPYPVLLGGTAPSSFQLSTEMFTGSDSTPFAGPAASHDGSIKGIYLQR